MYYEYIRPIKSWFLNWWYRKRRVHLPYCRNIEHAAELVKQRIYWQRDNTDWVKCPELTWGEKGGDCEDIAHLCAKFIKPFTKREVLHFICNDSRANHTILKFPNGVFDNGKLRYTTESYEELAFNHAGTNVKKILVENPDNMRIIRTIE